MNSELVRQALEKVDNPNILVNLVSRRLRQLNSGGGGLGRPLIRDTAGMSGSDIILQEIVEGAITYQELEPEVDEAPKRRKA